jgi:hypothetical protein
VIKNAEEIIGFRPKQEKTSGSMKNVKGKWRIEIMHGLR